MKKLYLFSLLMLIFITGDTYAPGDAGDNPQHKVHVSVMCDDHNTKLFIESHVKRELRSLVDVDVVELDMETNDFIIRIIAIGEIHKISEVAVSATFLYFFDKDKYGELVNQNRVRNHKYERAMLNYRLFFNTHTILHTAMTKDLDKICKDIIVQFDIKMLEPERQKR